MREYTLSITQRTNYGEEKVFEFYSNDKNVLYTVEPITYEESIQLLKDSLDYMIQNEVDKTLRERPTRERLSKLVETVRENLR